MVEEVELTKNELNFPDKRVKLAHDLCNEAEVGSEKVSQYIPKPRARQMDGEEKTPDSRKLKKKKAIEVPIESNDDEPIGTFYKMKKSQNPKRVKSRYGMDEKGKKVDVRVEELGVAVSAGVKARAAGPVEKIKFKEALTRKGGLQEYLECRNHILDLWSKDVSRILPLADCGLTDMPSENDPPRSFLIREIYAFLDKSGYINTGIASEKKKVKSNVNCSYRLLEQKNLDGNCGASVADTEDAVSFIMGNVKGSEGLLETNTVVNFEDKDKKIEAHGKDLAALREGEQGSLRVAFEGISAPREHIHKYVKVDNTADQIKQAFQALYAMPNLDPNSELFFTACELMEDKRKRAVFLNIATDEQKLRYLRRFDK